MEQLPGTGIVRVDTDLLRQWIMLPEGLDVVNAQMDMSNSFINLTIKHRSAPVVPDGVRLPTFMPVFQTKHDEDGTAWHRLLEIKVVK